MSRILRLTAIPLAVMLSFLTAYAQDLPDEVPASPKTPWHAFDVVTVEDPWTTRKVLLWLPNRLLDLWDMFKIDVGVGPSFGAVARVTKYVQFGYRDMSPASLRLGNLGRRAPVMLEKTSEMGVSPFYSSSYQRRVCPGEIGAGADLFLFGAYVGICLDEVTDFTGGLFGYDWESDDLS